MLRLIPNSKTILSVTALMMVPVLSLKAEKPNIIFILADDLGYGDISALNENSKITTPNLDNLCKQGIRFTDAHSNSSVSTPSRYGILTGRYAFRTSMKNGVLGGYSEPLIAADRSTMATMLTKQGYSTACIGKWHLGWNWAYTQKGDKQPDFSKPIHNGPTTRGFDYFYGISASLDMAPYVYVENDRPTAVPTKTSEDISKGILMQRSGPQSPDFEHSECLPNFTNRAVKYITDHKQSTNPYFLYIPLTAPHTPILPTGKYKGISGLSEYGDFVVMVDDMVGMIVEAVKRSGNAENTIIVFTSDNGCSPTANMREMNIKGHNSSYIYRGTKSDIYDGGHRMPLIVSWGTKYNNATENGIISLTDFYATFAELTGYRTPDTEAEDSYSMLQVLTQTGKSMRKDVVHHSIDGSFAIRDADWKLVFCAGSGGWSFPAKREHGDLIKTIPQIQLFNLTKDPGEKLNLEAQQPEKIEELTATMRKYIENGRSTPGAKQKNETLGEWKQTNLFMK